jgi:hypothetical protein
MWESKEYCFPLFNKMPRTRFFVAVKNAHICFFDFPKVGHHGDQKRNEMCLHFYVNVGYGYKSNQIKYLKVERNNYNLLCKFQIQSTYFHLITLLFLESNNEALN